MIHGIVSIFGDLQNHLQFEKKKIGKVVRPRWRSSTGLTINQERKEDLEDWEKLRRNRSNRRSVFKCAAVNHRVNNTVATNVYAGPLPR